MKKLITIFTALFLLSGCASTLHQATYSRYMEQGSRAFSAGDMITAEIAFARAVYNVDWGNLGDDAKARALYNLADTKRILRKYDEAETHYTQAAEVAKNVWPHASYEARMLNTGFVLLYLENEEVEKGWPYLKNTFTHSNSNKYGGNIKWVEIYEEYSAALSKINRTEEVAILREQIALHKK